MTPTSEDESGESDEDFTPSKNKRAKVKANASVFAKDKQPNKVRKQRVTHAKEWAPTNDKIATLIDGLFYFPQVSNTAVFSQLSWSIVK